MTTIDGGVLTMKNQSDTEKAKQIRWFGLQKGIPRSQVDAKYLGFKYNMNNVSAVIGLAQLEIIHNLIDKHIDNGKFFDKHLPNMKLQK